MTNRMGQQSFKTVSTAAQSYVPQENVPTTAQPHVQQTLPAVFLTTDPTTQVEELLQTWQQEYRRTQRPRQLIAGSLSIMGLLTAFITARIINADNASGSFGLGMLSALSLIVGILSANVFFNQNIRLTETQRQIAARIRDLDDVRAVGPLLKHLPTQALQGASGSDRRPARLPHTMIATLTRLLAKMNEQEAATLLRPHSAKLYQLVPTALTWNVSRSRTDLAIAIVRLLPTLAEREGLVCVARLIMCDAPTHDEQILRETARKALPLLLARVDLGGLPALTDWIHRLSISPQDNVTFDENLLSTLALTQLLPQMTPAEFLALGPKERQRIYANVLYVEVTRLHADYGVIVLDKVRRSADVEALATVRGLIGGPYATSYAQVRQAARDCLPALTAQLEKEKVSKTLLRGTSAPQSGGDVLLRPATGAPTTDPQLLLRANVEETNRRD